MDIQTHDITVSSSDFDFEGQTSPYKKLNHIYHLKYASYNGWYYNRPYYLSAETIGIHKNNTWPPESINTHHWSKISKLGYMILLERANIDSSSIIYNSRSYSIDEILDHYKEISLYFPDNNHDHNLQTPIKDYIAYKLNRTCSHQGYCFVKSNLIFNNICTDEHSLKKSIKLKHKTHSTINRIFFREFYRMRRLHSELHKELTQWISQWSDIAHSIYDDI
jgi:hypothetical protein